MPLIHEIKVNGIDAIFGVIARANAGEAKCSR